MVIFMFRLAHSVCRNCIIAIITQYLTSIRPPWRKTWYWAVTFIPLNEGASGF